MAWQRLWGACAEVEPESRFMKLALRRVSDLSAPRTRYFIPLGLGFTQ